VGVLVDTKTRSNSANLCVHVWSAATRADPQTLATNLHAVPIDCQYCQSIAVMSSIRLVNFVSLPTQMQNVS